MIFDNSKVRRLVPDFTAVIPFSQGAREIVDWYDADPSRQQVDAKMDATMNDLITPISNSTSEFVAYCSPQATRSGDQKKRVAQMTRWNLGRKAATVVATMGLSAVGLMVATPAQAALSDCNSGRFCIFQYSNGTGLYAKFTEGTDNLGSSKVFGGRMNDKASYVLESDLDSLVRLSEQERGRPLDDGRLRTQGNLLVQDPRDGFTWDNRVSSVRPALHIVPPRNPGAAYYSCIGSFIQY